MNQAFLHRSLAGIFCLTAMIAVLAAAPRSAAGPFNPKWVDARAQWMAHVDVTAMMNTKLVRHILENHEHFNIDLEGLADMHRELGLDPRTDIRDITAYGEGDPHEANMLLIITTSAKVDEVFEHVKTNAQNYREITTEGRTLHSFDQDGETMFFTIRPAGEDRTVLLTRDLNRLVQGLDIIDGKSPNLASAADSTEGTPKPAPGSVMFALINNMSWIHEGEDDPASQMLRKSQQLAIDLGEVEGKDFASISLAVNSAEDATNVADMLRGLMAMGRMVAKQDPELSNLADLVNAVNLDTAGNRVNVRIRQDSEKLIRVLHDAAAKHADHENDDDDDHHANHHGEMKKQDANSKSTNDHGDHDHH